MKETKIIDLGRPLRAGERVLVRNDLENHQRCRNYHNDAHDSFVGLMLKFRGKVVTIKSSGHKYRIEEFQCNWVDEMFDCLIEDFDGDDPQWEPQSLSLLM